MKKIIASVFAAAFLAVSAFSQVLDSAQTKNTTWMGFGAPVDGEITFHGFTNTFQTRYDIGKITLDAMLNWGFLANYNNDGDVDNFRFGTTNSNPLSLKYGSLSGKVDFSNTLQDSYYVNFIWHPVKNLDVGIGTKLNWQVGSSPRYGGWLWEHDAHVRQGGFATKYDDRSGSVAQTSSETARSYKFAVDAPGSSDVVGFVPYANRYAKRALGVRYTADINGVGFQVGAAVPNGFNTDDPAMNFGFEIAPVKWLSLATSIEGAFDSASNFYFGATIGMKSFILYLYGAADRLFTDEDDDEAFSFGATFEYNIPKTKIKIVPELAFNFFSNGDYTPAFYFGGTLVTPIAGKFGFNLWASFASGSKNKQWEKYDFSKDWTGGSVLNLRPELTFDVSKRMTVSAYLDFESRKAYEGTSRNCWASGVFMTYVF